MFENKRRAGGVEVEDWPETSSSFLIPAPIKYKGHISQTCMESQHITQFTFESSSNDGLTTFIHLDETWTDSTHRIGDTILYRIGQPYRLDSVRESDAGACQHQCRPRARREYEGLFIYLRPSYSWREYKRYFNRSNKSLLYSVPREGREKYFYGHQRYDCSNCQISREQPRLTESSKCSNVQPAVSPQAYNSRGSGEVSTTVSS